MAVVFGQNIAAFVKTAMRKACCSKQGAMMPRLLTSILLREAPIVTDETDNRLMHIRVSELDLREKRRGDVCVNEK